MNSYHLAAFAALTALTPASASGFFDGMDGRWTGEGSAYVRPLGDITARCTLTVRTEAAGARMEGACRKGPFSRSLNLRLQSDNGRDFVGTYDGTRDGVARLSGTAHGDTLTLSILWPKVVNGDRIATLSLRRGGAGLSQTVTDDVKGSPRTTSQFTFRRATP